VHAHMAYAPHAVQKRYQIREMDRRTEVHAVEGEKVRQGLFDAASDQVEVLASIGEHLRVNGDRPIDGIEEVDLDGDDLARFQVFGEVLFEKRRRRTAAVRGHSQVDLVVADVLAVVDVEYLGFGHAGE